MGIRLPAPLLVEAGDPHRPSSKWLDRGFRTVVLMEHPSYTNASLALNQANWGRSIPLHSASRWPTYINWVYVICMVGHQLVTNISCVNVFDQQSIVS